MPDWSGVYQQFKPIYSVVYRRAALTAVGMAVLSGAAGAAFFWLVEDAAIPAYIAWGAGAVLLLLGLRNASLGARRKPFVLAGRVVKKHAVVRADAHRTKYTKPMLGMEVSEAFELNPSGRGPNLPANTGPQLMVVSRWLFRRVNAGDAVVVLCMPSGEGAGLVVGDRLALPGDGE